MAHFLQTERLEPFSIFRAARLPWISVDWSFEFILQKKLFWIIIGTRRLPCWQLVETAITEWYPWRRSILQASQELACVDGELYLSNIDMSTPKSQAMVSVNHWYYMVLFKYDRLCSPIYLAYLRLAFNEFQEIRTSEILAGLTLTKNPKCF